MTKGPMAKSILVIEDEAEIRRFAFRVLDLEGYSVLQAANGEEGLRLARQMKRLSMVLLDLKLPDRDGWMVLEEFRHDPKLSTIPILVFSASSTQRQQSKALDMGASGYLVKPVAAANLRQATAATVRGG